MPRELAFTSPPALAVAVGATTPVGQIGAEIWSTTALRRLVWTGTQWVDAMGGGNAATATALQTARTINGVSFDGTANINIDTVSGLVINDGYTEEVFTVTGTAPVLAATNGSIQLWTLTGNSTPTNGLLDGQSIVLGIDDGAGFTVTWPSVVWAVTPVAAPTLAATGLTWVALWRVGGVLHGKY